MRNIRQYTALPLTQGNTLALEGEKAHHLKNVMRVRAGELLYLFNETYGEWQVKVHAVKNTGLNVEVLRQTKPPDRLVRPSIHLMVSMIKKSRLEWLAEKVTELGVSHIHLCIAERSSFRTMHLDRLRKIAEEAVEQSGQLLPPKISAPTPLRSALKAQTKNFPWLLCLQEGMPIATHLTSLPPAIEKIGVIIGPEGGWTEQELSWFHGQPLVTPVNLGCTTLRAETAGLVAVSHITGYVHGASTV